MTATDSRRQFPVVGGIEVFGGTYPAQIWQTFSAAMLAGTPDTPFPAAGSVCDRAGVFVTDAPRAGSTTAVPDTPNNRQSSPTIRGPSATTPPSAATPAIPPIPPTTPTAPSATAPAATAPPTAPPPATTSPPPTTAATAPAPSP